MQKKYNDQTVYFSAYAKLPEEMPSAYCYKGIDIGLVIDTQTGKVVDASFTLITEEARTFLKEIILDHDLHKEGIDPIIESIKCRFFGSSQKAICVALRGVFEKYQMWLQKDEENS